MVNFNGLQRESVMLKIIITFLIILELKTIRDCISFRFTISILDYLPIWLKRWLRGGNLDYDIDYRGTAWDGWHVSDGLIITGAWFVMVWIEVGLITAGWTTPIFWVAFYPIAFNFNYHWVHTKPKHRDL